MARIIKGQRWLELERAKETRIIEGQTRLEKIRDDQKLPVLEKARDSRK